MPSTYGLIGGANTKLKNMYGNIGGINTKLKSVYGNIAGANARIFSSALATWVSAVHNWGSYTPTSHDNTSSSVNIILPTGSNHTVTYGYDYTFTTPLYLPAGTTLSIYNWLMQSQGGNQMANVLFDDVQKAGVYVSSMGTGDITQVLTISADITVSKISCQIVKVTSSAEGLRASMSVTVNLNSKSFMLNGSNTSDNQ